MMNDAESLITNKLQVIAEEDTGDAKQAAAQACNDKALRDALILQHSTWAVTVFALDGSHRVLHQNPQSVALLGDLVPQGDHGRPKPSPVPAVPGLVSSSGGHSVLLHIFAGEPQKLNELLAEVAAEGGSGRWNGVVRVLNHKAPAAAATTGAATATAAAAASAAAANDASGSEGLTPAQQPCPPVGCTHHQSQHRAVGQDKPPVRRRLFAARSEPYCEQAALVEAGPAAGSDGGANHGLHVPTAGGLAAMDRFPSTGAAQDSTRAAHNRACTNSNSGININRSNSDVNKATSSNNRLLGKLWDLPRVTETEAATVGLVLDPCHGDERCGCHSHISHKRQQQQQQHTSRQPAAPAGGQQLADAASAPLPSAGKGGEKKRFSLSRLRHLALGLVNKVRLSAAGSEATGSGNSKCSSGSASWSARGSGARESLHSISIAAAAHAGTAQTAASFLSSTFYTKNTVNTRPDDCSFWGPFPAGCSYTPPGLYDRTCSTTGSHGGRTLLQPNLALYPRASPHMCAGPVATSTSTSAAGAASSPHAIDDRDPWAAALATSTLALNRTQTGLHPAYLTSMYRPSGDGSEMASPFTAPAYPRDMHSPRTTRQQQQQPRHRPSAPVVPLRTASFGADVLHYQPLAALSSVRSAVSVTGPPPHKFHAAPASAVWAFRQGTSPSHLLRAHSEQPHGRLPAGLEGYYAQLQQQQQPGMDTSPRVSAPGFPCAGPSSWHVEGVHAQQALIIGVPMDAHAAPVSCLDGDGGSAMLSRLQPQRLPTFSPSVRDSPFREPHGSGVRHDAGPLCSAGKLRSQHAGAVGPLGGVASAPAAGSYSGPGGGGCGGGANSRLPDGVAAPAGGAASPAGGLTDGDGGGSGGGGVQPGWHQVWAVRTTDAVTGEAAFVLYQHDVTARVLAERRLALVAETQHRLLAQLFPRHVLQGITRLQLAAAPAPAGAASQPSSPAAAASAAAVPPPRKSATGVGAAAAVDYAPLATWHEQVTLLCADVVGFTPMCSVVHPAAVMAMLNDLFSRFDALLDKHGVSKVETIGDCYIVAGGLMGCGPEQQQQVHGGNDAEESPAAMASTRGGRAGGTLTAHKSAHTAEAGLAAVAGASGNSTTARSKGHRGTQSYRDPLHAHKVFAFAQDMLEAAACVPCPTGSGEAVQIRIGLHSGPVVSGVVGARMPRFALFGDTVNTASRVEAAGEAGTIHVSATTHALLLQPRAAAAAAGTIGTAAAMVAGTPGGGAAATVAEAASRSSQEWKHQPHTWQPGRGISLRGKGNMPTYLWPSKPHASV